MIKIYLEESKINSEKNNRNWEHQKGEFLLRKGVKEEYGIVLDLNTEIPVVIGKHGKPQLKAYPQIYHNISHTEGLVACAIGNVPVGIDVEHIRPFSEKILRRVMSEKERACYETLDKDEKIAFFFKIWTLKESYVKAAGCGITIPLTDFSFDIKGERISSTIPEVYALQYRIKGDYILSVCTFKPTFVSFATGSDLRS